MAAYLRVPVKDEKGTGEPLADMEVEGPRPRSSPRVAAPTFVSKEGGVVVLPTKVSAAAVSGRTGRTLTGSRGQDALKEVRTQTEDAEDESPVGAEGISFGKSTSGSPHADFTSLVREENNRRAAEQEERDQRFFSLMEASQLRSQQVFEARQRKWAAEQEQRNRHFFSLLESSQQKSAAEHAAE